MIFDDYEYETLACFFVLCDRKSGRREAKLKRIDPVRANSEISNERIGVFLFFDQFFWKEKDAGIVGLV